MTEHAKQALIVAVVAVIVLGGIAYYLIFQNGQSQNTPATVAPLNDSGSLSQQQGQSSIDSLKPIKAATSTSATPSQQKLLDSLKPLH